MRITDDDILIWWAVGGYPLIVRETGYTKARCRRERKRIFKLRGWTAESNNDLERYREALLKGRILMADLA